MIQDLFPGTKLPPTPDLKVIKSLFRRANITSVQKNETFVRAVWSGKTAIAHFLLHQGANVQGSYDEALRVAAHSGHMRTAKMLVEHGADLEVLRHTALHWPATKKVFEALQKK